MESDEIPMRVGDLLDGYCGGYFGRDRYDAKRVEALGGDWVLVRNSVTNKPELALCNPETLLPYRRERETRRPPCA